MNSEFFPQYLFNTNQVNGEKIIFLLKQAAKSEASLAVRVLRKYSIRPEQFMEILPLNQTASLILQTARLLVGLTRYLQDK